MIRGRRSGRPRVRQPMRSSSPVQEDKAGERVVLPRRVIPKKMDVRLIKDFKALVPCDAPNPALDGVSSEGVTLLIGTL